MMATTPMHGDELDLIEKLSRTTHLNAEITRKNQEVQFAPWQLAFAGVAAGGGLVAAGAALMKLMGG